VNSHASRKHAPATIFASAASSTLAFGHLAPLLCAGAAKLSKSQRKEVVFHLAYSARFRHLTDEEQAAFTDMFCVVECRRGQLLARRGDEITALWRCCEGFMGHMKEALSDFVPNYGRKQSQAVRRLLGNKATQENSHTVRGQVELLTGLDRFQSEFWKGSSGPIALLPLGAIMAFFGVSQVADIPTALADLAASRRSTSTARSSPGKLVFDDLQVHLVSDRGVQGAVRIAEHKATKQMLACKVIPKAHAVLHEAEANQEVAAIQAMASSTFVPQARSHIAA
jgi:hypothetical protein